MLLLNRNRNEAKYFQMSPDPPHGAAGSRTISAPLPPATPVKGVLILFSFSTIDPFPKITPKEKNCLQVPKPSDKLKDGRLKRGENDKKKSCEVISTTSLVANPFSP